MLVKFPTEKRIFWCNAQEVSEVRVEAKDPDKPIGQQKGPFAVKVFHVRDGKFAESKFQFETLEEAQSAADSFAEAVNVARKDSSSAE